jgi:hypothetical protein
MARTTPKLYRQPDKGGDENFFEHSGYEHMAASIMKTLAEKVLG